jgi:hypothetical protein
VPRAFNGSASITCSIGGAGAFGFGTMACIARRTDESNWHGIVATVQTGGSAFEAYLDIAPSSHGTASAIWSSWGGTDNSGTLKFNSANGWCLVACTKATGSATPRYHKYVFSSSTWSHGNGVGAVSNATSAPGGNVKFGDVGGDALNGDIAAAALYDRALSDQEIESLAGSWELWLACGPVGAWLFDQAATGQTLVDWVGGANQSAITGTSVTTASQPGWNQSDGGIWVAEVTAAGGGTDATASPSTVAAVAAVPAAAVSVGSAVPAATVVAVTAVGAPTLQLGTLIGAGTVAATGAVGTVALQADANLTATTVAATTAVPAPTPTTGSTAILATVAATGAVPTPTLHTGETVTAATLAAVAAVPAPSIATGGSTVVSAATVAASAAIAVASLSTGQRVSAATVAATAAVPAATVQISRTVAAAVVAASGDVPAATAQTGVQVAALTVAALAAIPAPTLTAAAAALVGVLTSSLRSTSSQASATSRTGGPR